MTAPTDPDDKFVTALGRGLQILAAFRDERELGNRDLSERTGLPATSITRLTYTLEELGYLRRAPGSRRFLPGAALLGLSASIQKNAGVLEAVRPHMEALAREMDTTVILGMRDRLSIVFVDLVRPATASLTVNTDIGSLVPLGTTSAGLAYLVAAPLAERTRLLRDLHTHLGDREGMTLRQEIQQAHESLRRHGFVVRVRNASSAVNSVSVPLHVDGSQLHVLTCAGPIRDFSRKRLTDHLGPRLVQVAAAVRAHQHAAGLRKPPSRTMQAP